MKNRAFHAASHRPRTGRECDTRLNRSPLINPSESAYVAPSENPPTAMRAGSTATVSKDPLKGTVHESYIGSKTVANGIPAGATRVGREHGDSGFIRGGTQSSKHRFGFPPAAVETARTAANGALVAFAGSCRIASRSWSNPSVLSRMADVSMLARGRAVSLPSPACRGSITR